jgi:hypothetical protein
MKFNYGRIFLLGFGFFGVSVIWGVYNAFVPIFLADKFHLAPVWIGFFMTNSARLGTYAGLNYLFSTLSAIVGPNVNGWIIQLTSGNYNNIMLFAPIFMIIALVLLWGVRRGEAVTA